MDVIRNPQKPSLKSATNDGAAAEESYISARERSCSRQQQLSIHQQWGDWTGGCPATIITRISTGDLASGSLPDHNHSNKLLKLVAKNTEATVINHFATLKVIGWPYKDQVSDGWTGYDTMSKNDLMFSCKRTICQNGMNVQITY